MAFGLLSDIAGLFFPLKFTFCQKGIKNTEPGICPDCVKTLPYTGDKSKQKGDFYTLCVSPLYYSDKARKAVMRFKFNGKTNYARVFGALLAECIRQNLAGLYDLISWIPLSGKKLKKRGYAQSALLAMAAALALDDVAVDLLDKPKDTPAQSTLKGRSQRKANVSGAYTVKEIGMVKGKRILLIDDIITTGATLSECARVLLNAGASEIVCAALCRARD